MKNQIRFLALAVALLAFTQASQAAVINWDDGGVDSEWNTAANWDGDILPGTSAVDRALLSAGDSVVVTSTVTTTSAVDLHLNDGTATLAIGADISSLRRLTDVVGSVTHTAGALQFTDTGSFSFIGGSYTISGGSLGFNGDLTIDGSGVFAVDGNAAAVSVGNGADDNLILTDTGGLDFTFNAAGISTIAVSDTFDIAATALLELDLTGFAGTGTFDLVTFATISGSFTGSNVTGLGDLGDGRIASLGSDTGSLFVSIAAIPEPGTYALLSGLSGLVFVMLRRRR